MVFIIFERERERERETESEQGRGRDRETQNLKQAPAWAVSTEPDAGLEPTNCEIMTWVEVRRLTDWVTQAPLDFLINPTNTERGLMCQMCQALGTVMNKVDVVLTLKKLQSSGRNYRGNKYIKHYLC